MKIAHIFYMNLFVFILIFLICWNLTSNLLKELHPVPHLRVFLYVLFFYFVTVFLLQTKLSPVWIFFFFLVPVFLLSAVILIIQQQKEQKFLQDLYKFLPSLIAQMKLGFSFPDAWQQSLKDIENQELVYKLKDILDTLRFQKPFSHSKKEIMEFVQHINRARLSSQSLKRLKQFHEKIKIEQLFYRKASKVLMQLRLQSGILGLLYLLLLIWTVFSNGWKHLNLILLSFFFFFIGLIWIFKTGRRMKWSL